MSTDDLAGKGTDITEQYTTPNASQAAGGELGGHFDTDVVVGGSGPAGGTAASLLATYGIRTQVVTKYGWVANSPRAHITNQRAIDLPHGGATLGGRLDQDRLQRVRLPRPLPGRRRRRTQPSGGSLLSACGGIKPTPGPAAAAS